ncbi:MAG: TRAP transporter small permease [Kiritimatiellia bacterium]|nr:TRAP transporter small permease [Kiritimatiellia bacterium]
MSTWLANICRHSCDWLDRLERGLLTLLMTSMVALAAVQILLRNVWQTGFQWAEPLLGMGLLWLTMLGALAATGLGRHIAIDLAAALLPKKGAIWIRRAIALFASIVCGILAWAAGRYVGFQRSMAMGDLFGWPQWKFFMVIPVTFWLMAIRFAGRTFLPATWRATATDLESLAGEGRGSL